MLHTRLLVVALALIAPAFASAQALPPDIALQRMQPADGLRVELVASEPLIRQPVTMTFDTRGRMWVIQYLQYPTPAGLKATEVDQFLRTKYDRKPEPPPKGPRGLDRITILSDQDEHGRFTKGKDFVSGLNLASGLALGNGGVYALQAPYLLFYADANGDDVPDGEPQVLLDGFGMEDAHAVGNSLIWGPDGWLYGAQGSTVTATIRDPRTGRRYEFQQGVWRYHPRTKQFELFAEGGGNTWGLDFDRAGNVIAGTNWGGHAALHMMQDGYYVKGFAKHGPLHNPHTYGYLEHLPCEGFRGGHVTCGGIVYQGTLLPERFRGKYLACNLLDNNLYWYDLAPRGSTFRMKHEGTLLAGNDPWFRPIDMLTGPEGAVYVVDWYDKRANHVDPVDNWDKSNGRIYRLVPKDYRREPVKDVAKLSSAELVALLRHENSWQRGEARRLLIERRDGEAAKLLADQVRAIDVSNNEIGAWYGAGGLNETHAKDLLQFPHRTPAVRAFLVRLLFDHATAEGVKPYADVLHYLIPMAKREQHHVVLSHLAIAAKRWITAQGSTEWCYSLLREIVNNPDVTDDPQIPLLIWWAVEAAITHDGKFFAELLPLTGEHPLHGFLAERIVRRLMAGGAVSEVSQLLLQWSALRESMLRGLTLAMELQPVDAPKLAMQVRELGGSLSLLIRLGDAEAACDGLKQLSVVKDADLGVLLRALQSKKLLTSDILVTLARTAKSEATRQVVLYALAGFGDVVVAKALIEQYSAASKAIRNRIVTLLLARKESALLLGRAVEAGAVPAKDISLDQVQQLARLGDAGIDAIIRKHWGSVAGQTTGEKQARIRSVLHMLNQKPGDVAAGHKLYTQHCGNCHQLFGTGGKVGPDLTSVDRKREFLATHIVDPSLIVRPEFAAQTVVTTDGRTLTGLVTEENGLLSVVDSQVQKTTLPRSQVEAMTVAKQSLMPEKLLDPLDDQQIRDLFTYLQKPVEAKVELPFPASPIREPVKFDFADKMVTGLERFLNDQLEAAPGKRDVLWKQGLAPNKDWDAFFAAKRQDLQRMIGAVEQRPKVPELQYVASPTQLSRIAKCDAYTVDMVRWRAFGNVWVEGLLLEPAGGIKAQVVAIPDADETPEQLAGLTSGIPATRQLARRLAEQGCRVLVPTLVSRSDAYSGSPGFRMTNQPHREWIYRQAFEMGRHIIGYEVLMVQSGIDWLSQNDSLPVGLTGYGEGGLIAFYTGAIDERVKITLVDGYFSTRETVWKEPIYRNVFGQLKTLGDAEIARLYMSRGLVINQSASPVVMGPPKPRDGRSGAAPGELLALDAGNEWGRYYQIGPHFKNSELLEVGAGVKLNVFVSGLGIVEKEQKASARQVEKQLPSSDQRMARLVKHYTEHTQQLLRRSEAVRKRDSNTIAGPEIQQPRHLMERLKLKLEHDVIGKIDRTPSPAQPRARLYYEQPTYTAYEVELDVFAPHVIAYGWLLVPKDIKPGEKRPVVVCQHGLEGRPSDLADPTVNNKFYHQFGCRLAERGFIVFAPQNPYIFGDRFRLLQRRANPLGLSLFSFIIAQHRQITDWLATLPFVDGDRIGFYGLSYGGKTAMRVPAVVPRYCLSICSADFNEWIWKNVSIDNGYTYMLTGEWEMPEWNLGHTFNYAEMAALIAPRPFMVERGHRDGVAPDEQVAYEYAKVRRHYADLKIPERTEIEFFDGPHCINGKGTFEFLHKHLNWPKPK
jgi:putative membrane-bound dehydrogenase-like protein